MKRWDPGYDHYPDTVAVDGEWVRYTDVVALLTLLRDIRPALACEDTYHPCSDLRRRIDAALVQNETPLDAGMRGSEGENAPVVDSDNTAEWRDYVKSQDGYSR